MKQKVGIPIILYELDIFNTVFFCDQDLGEPHNVTGSLGGLTATEGETK